MENHFTDYVVLGLLITNHLMFFTLLHRLTKLEKSNG